MQFYLIGNAYSHDKVLKVYQSHFPLFQAEKKQNDT